MRLIDADALIEDSKKYLNTLNPDNDGKECAKIYWLINVLNEASTVEQVQDTISRQAAIDIASGFCHPANIAKELAKLPSAHPEIIRCKECKHWLDIDDGRQKHRMCADIYGDWFCADAERRADEQ